MSSIVTPGVLAAQDTNKVPDASATQPPAAKDVLVQIADEPKTIDPATFVPTKLAAKVTKKFTESSINEVAQWVQQEQQIPVLFDTKALSDAGIPLGEPVTDQLTNEPLYLLLNRLKSIGLAWYFQDEILHITTVDVAKKQMLTQPYNVGDLLDAGYSGETLIDTILNASPGQWESVQGEGAADPELLGDVLFVMQTHEAHRALSGLLTALRKHGRQTFIFDPPQHIQLRQKLDENVSVTFRETPLVSAVQELARQTNADIRLDMAALRDRKIRDREPVSLTLADRKLSTVLEVLLADRGLTWVLRDGVLWLTSDERASQETKTALYDVRDLCRNQSESDELLNALENQTKGPWESVQGEGGTIDFAKPGTMFIVQTESAHRAVADMLATYRKALLESKPRKRDDASKEVVTHYYRMDERIADDLIKLLPQIVQPETWVNEQRPNAIGTVTKVASRPEVLDSQGRPAFAADGKSQDAKTSALVVSRAVLIVRQTRAAHDEIAKLITRIEQGDPPAATPKFRGGGGFGGGGFGGGIIGN